MNEVRILPVEEKHLAAIHALETLCFPEEPWSESALHLLLEPVRACGLVAVRGDQILGYIGAVLAPDEVQITNVAVHPDARRMGIGRALCRTLMTHARAIGRAQISLEVRASNEAAVSLYASLGFCVAGRRRNFYRRPTEDGLVMLCELSSDRT